MESSYGQPVNSHVCDFGYWSKLYNFFNIEISQKCFLFSVILISLFYIIFSIVCFTISVWCMRGVYLRIHTDVKPMMQLMGIVIVLSVIEMFFISIVLGLLRFIFCGYQFIVMYSLYAKYKDEHENDHLEEGRKMNVEPSQAHYERISEAK